MRGHHTKQDEIAAGEGIKKLPRDALATRWNGPCATRVKICPERPTRVLFEYFGPWPEEADTVEFAPPEARKLAAALVRVADDIESAG